MVQSAIGWAGTCDTAGKPSKPGWSSGPTSASQLSARINLERSGRQRTESRQLAPEEAFEHLGRPGRALLAAHVNVGGQRGFRVPELVGS
jgi:hypothetical protein